MANFDQSATRREAVRNANNILDLVQQTYRAAKLVQQALALYQAGTDPVFNAAVGALFTAAERQELGTMAQQINTLVADWETNHAGALAGG